MYVTASTNQEIQLIIVFFAFLAVIYFGGEYVYRTHVKRQAREMTDERLREELNRVPGYGAAANIYSDELARREEVVAMMERTQ
jgi:hypothetical protein